MIKVDYKDDVISKTTEPFEPRHGDDKSKKVINNSVKKLIDHSFKWNVSDRLEFVVNVKLGTHIDEAENINKADCGSENKGVPGFMTFIEQGVNYIPNE